MQEIDLFIDEQPDFARELIQQSIRNHQAYQELEAYNDRGIFVFKHPFTRERLLYDQAYSELYSLKQSNPEGFIQACYSIRRNLQRYARQLENNRFQTEESRKQAQENLHRYTLKEQIAQSLLK